MTHLRAGDGFAGRGDEFYERLLAAHSGLTEADSRALNARLVLLLAHEVGDLSIIDAALVAARRGLAAQDSNQEQG